MFTVKNYENIFRNSYTRALGGNSYNAGFIEEFYRHFMSRSKEIADLFANVDMSAQKTMLHDSLEHMVDFYTTKKLSPQLERLAKVHGKQQLNIAPSLYDVWLDSLMAALAKYDAEFNPEVELSWRLVLAPGITYLKYSYDH